MAALRYRAANRVAVPPSLKTYLLNIKNLCGDFTFHFFRYQQKMAFTLKMHTRQMTRRQLP